MLYDVIPPSRLRAVDLTARYKAVITAGLWYLADRDLAELRKFAEQGGVWLDIGASGKFNDAGQVRMQPRRRPRSERLGNGLILRRENLDEVLRLPRFALYLLEEGEANDLQEITKLYAASIAGAYPFPILKEGEDLKALLEASTGVSLAVLPGTGVEGLRCNVWRKQDGAGEKVVAHFVNYYSPIPTRAEFIGERFELGGSPEQYAPKVLENVTVRLRLPHGKATSLTAFDPDSSSPVALKYTQTKGVVEFRVPPIRIYEIVQVTLAGK